MTLYHPNKMAFLKTLYRLSKVSVWPYLGSLDQLVDEVHSVVAVVGLAHHLGHPVGADAIIWSTKEREKNKGWKML